MPWPPPNPAADELIVILNGSPFMGWIDCSVSQDFDKASGNGHLTLTEQPGNPFPARLCDPVQIICAGKPVMTGFVHSIDGTHDIGTHSIKITIRDKTQNLVDSTLGPGHDYEPPIKHVDLANRVIKKMGLDFTAIDKINPPEYGPAEVPNGDIEEFGLSYLDRWAQQRQIVHNTDGKGNLVIDRNMMRTGPGMLHKGPEDDPLNNVLRAQFKNTVTDRYNQNAASAQKSTNDRPYWEGRPKGDPPAQANPLSRNWGIETDGEIMPQRRRHFRARRGIDRDSPKKAAKWRSSVAKARGFQYTAKVQGFEAAPGTLWWHGYLIPVFDYHFLISDMLFITGVKFHKSLKDGASTEVVCTLKDAFTDKGAGSGGAKRGQSSGMGTGGQYDPADFEDYGDTE